MSFFYRFVAAAMDLNNFESPTPGMATPYSAFFIFSVGIFVSNFLFNTIVMRRPSPSVLYASPRIPRLHALLM
jgi:glucose uptake protein